jgi:hypothetical protein
MARRDEFADVTKLASRLKARNAERAREGCFYAPWGRPVCILQVRHCDVAGLHTAFANRMLHSSRQAESLSHATEVLGDSLPSSQ